MDKAGLLRGGRGKRPQKKDKKKTKSFFALRAPTADPIYDNEAATANGGMPHAAGATPIWCI
jgi:hypothetical protein